MFRDHDQHMHIVNIAAVITCSKLTIETPKQRCEICSKLTIKTQNNVNGLNFEHISHFCSSVSIVTFEHVIARWDGAKSSLARNSY